MTTLWKGLEPEDHERIFSMVIGPYLHGSCYAFAIALSRGTGWPMVGLMNGDLIWHAGVRDPNGTLRDARGVVSEEEFGDPFNLLPPYDIKPVTEEELVITKSVRDMEIDFASKMAQAIWPDLPWKPTTLRGRVSSFAEDLERISREHKIWIRGCFPASLPVLAEGVGDEKGYKLEFTVDGLTYTINREL